VTVSFSREALLHAVIPLVTMFYVMSHVRITCQVILSRVTYFARPPCWCIL